MTGSGVTVLSSGPATADAVALGATLPMAPDAPVGALVALAVLGITVAALLSAGEAALSRLTRSAAAELVAAGHRGAVGVQRLTEHRTRASEAATYVLSLIHI